VGTLAAYLLLHDIAPNPRGERFDLTGAILFCIGLVCLLLAITSAIGSNWLSPMILSLFGVGIVAFVIFAIHERRVSYPMLDLHLFDNRQYGLSVAAATLQSLATFAVNFILIYYLQGVRGYTPLTAALLILPLPIMTSVIGPFGGRWADRVGGAIPASLGLAIQIGALILLMMLTPTTPYLVLALTLALMGIGGALFWSPNTSTAMGAAPRNRLGVASATLNTLRNVGMVFSFAVALAVAAASMPPVMVSEVFLGTVVHMQASIATAFTGAMSHAFLASIVICAVALAFSAVRQNNLKVRSTETAAATPEAATTAARTNTSGGGGQ
jgi:MFS family permease